MPAFLIPVIGFIASWVVRAMIVKFVVAFGIGITVYKVSSWGIDEMKNYFYQGYHQLPAALLDLLNIGGFEFGIEIIFSAIAVRGALLAVDSFSKMTIGGS